MAALLSLRMSRRRQMDGVERDVELVNFGGTVRLNHKALDRLLPVFEPPVFPSPNTRTGPPR